MALICSLMVLIRVFSIWSTLELTESIFSSSSRQPPNRLTINKIPPPYKGDRDSFFHDAYFFNSFTFKPMTPQSVSHNLNITKNLSPLLRLCIKPQQYCLSLSHKLFGCEVIKYSTSQPNNFIITFHGFCKSRSLIRRFSQPK